MNNNAKSRAVPGCAGNGISTRLRQLGLATALALAMVGGADATVINFSAAGQPGMGSYFVGAGNAIVATIDTADYTIQLSGGVFLGPDTADLPADPGVIYGTADFANDEDSGQSGYTNPLTIQFFEPGTSNPKPVTNFFVDLLNGNTVSVDYTVADNMGNGFVFNVVPNLDSGRKTVGFVAAGDTITLTAGPAPEGCCEWDFFIDNIGFNEPLPPDALSGGIPIEPLPPAAWLFGTALVGLVLARRHRPG